MLPGFAPTLGLTLFVLSVLVVIPLGGLFVKASGLSLAQDAALLATPRVAAAFRLSFGVAFAAAAGSAADPRASCWGT